MICNIMKQMNNNSVQKNERVAKSINKINFPHQEMLQKKTQ